MKLRQRKDATRAQPHVVATAKPKPLEDAYPVGGAAPPSDLHSPSKTSELAQAFNPAGYRVRLTSWKDFLHVVKARYMETVFKSSSALLFLQIFLMAFRGPDVGSPSSTNATTLDALAQIGHMPVADACRMAYGELLWIAPVFLLMTGSLLFRRGRSVYMLDFSTFSPPESWRISHDELIQTLRAVASHREAVGATANTEADIEFQQKVLANSGTGQSTAWPPGIVRCLKESRAPSLTLEETREEARVILRQTLQSLFERTGVQPKEVDFLVINCSLFSPTPSLCAMACHEFQFRSSLRTYNLSGQGCSASLLSVDLAADLLRSNPNSIAVVVSTELITGSLYHGHLKGMLLQNTLFRSGGAAIMLTNKASRIMQARYRLRHIVRTQCADDTSYRAVYEQEDDEGNCGVSLSKEIVKVAGNAIKVNLTQLGPLILPLSEQLKVILSIMRKKLGLGAGESKYVPSFKSAIHFFCIHAGGRAVLDGLEKSLRLLPEDVKPSRAVLHSMGNTSSSSIWYELRHIEENTSIRRGHKVLQLAFGSGFKCNSAVWTRLR